MKAKLKKQELLDALNTVNKAVNANNTLPVLNNILLKANSETLELSATNLEIAIKTIIPSQTETEGSITIPAKVITSYIALLPEEEVTLTSKKDLSLEIKTNSSETNIKGISAEEFPLIPKVSEETSFEIPSKVLISAIEKTTFSASTNTARPVLLGILFDLKKDNLKVVATDSFRLAEENIKLEKDTGTEIACIIPARTFDELGKILVRYPDKNVKIHLEKNQVLFSVETTELTSRLIEGKFPDYEKIIPREHRTKITVKTNELMFAVKRVSIFARENNNNVKLEFKDGAMTINTDDTRVGHENASIESEIDGEENRIAINVQYLQDVLNVTKTEKVDLMVVDKLSPAIAKEHNNDEYTYLIMPLNIYED